MISSVKLLQLKGSPAEKGKVHGEAYREEIRQLIQLLWKNLSVYSPLVFSKESLLKINLKNLPSTEEFAPDLVEEMRGISAGAQVDFEEIFFLNSAFNLINIGDIRSTLPLLACTSFGVSGDATGDQSTYIGENCDTFKFFERYTCLLKLEDDVHPAALVYTVPGVLAHAGMNSLGLGLNVNYLCSNDVQFGKIPAVVIRKVLQFERMGDGIAAIITGKRASGANYVIGDGEGNIFNIETSSGDYDIIYPRDGVIGHANHYRSPLMKQYQVDRPISIGDSIMRDYRINRLLSEKRGHLALPQLIGNLMDHTNFPSSICFHGRRKEAVSDGDVSTVTSMIQDLTKGELHICSGPPCKGEFETFTI
jgi:isopenicillin-N N-acyltransferase-like protein